MIIKNFEAQSKPPFATLIAILASTSTAAAVVGWSAYGWHGGWVLASIILGGGAFVAALLKEGDFHDAQVATYRKSLEEVSTTDLVVAAHDLRRPAATRALVSQLLDSRLTKKE